MAKSDFGNKQNTEGFDKHPENKLKYYTLGMMRVRVVFRCRYFVMLINN